MKLYDTIAVDRDYQQEQRAGYPLTVTRLRAGAVVLARHPHGRVSRWGRVTHKSGNSRFPWRVMRSTVIGDGPRSLNYRASELQVLP